MQPHWPDYVGGGLLLSDLIGPAENYDTAVDGLPSDMGKVTIPKQIQAGLSYKELTQA